MFPALTCASSGGKIVFTQHPVSSLSVNVCTVHSLRAESALNECTVQTFNEIILHILIIQVLINILIVHLKLAAVSLSLSLSVSHTHGRARAHTHTHTHRGYILVRINTSGFMHDFSSASFTSMVAQTSRNI
jgi:hypothetical protein